jgi:hypothetical protein
MIKKQLLFILAVTTFGYVNTAHSQSPDSCKVKEKEIFLSLSSEKYDKVYLVPQETDGVPIF